MSIDYHKKIAIGTVQFGLKYGISNQQGQTSRQEASAILDLAKKSGITTIDTAQEYGSSEKVVGELHQDRFDIVTKVKLNTTDLPIEQLVPQSSERLQTDSLYGILYHNEVSLLENPESLDYLKRLKEKGTIKKFGYTAVSQPDALQDLVTKFGLPDIVQIPYSHLDRRFENLLTELHLEGVEIHARSAFLQGLYFLSDDAVHPHFDEIKDYLKTMKTLFPQPSARAAALLRFALERPFIDKVVIGLNSAVQLEENLNNIALVESLDFDAPVNVSENILMPNLWPST